MLDGLRDDGWIGEDDVDRVARRLSAGASTLHALVRLGGAGLLRRDAAGTLWVATDGGQAAAGSDAVDGRASNASTMSERPVAKAPPPKVIAASWAPR